jgi:sialate O-acetylesterase
VAVRFGWNQIAEPNLSNKAGLPASPFRTDRWPDAKNAPAS